ncbi:hypothetical protein PIIN_09080 [Serendipita indica DSM 11827]|uniref:Uncharacterized protein n=1 Tax=Serendipita indica (strain DSM 11827) TaxID=1109443 RepID=G4TUV2_SERID|nr:hypothetical protein PIIN_09080 [Serendipita indica DSM 11827]
MGKRKVHFDETAEAVDPDITLKQRKKAKAVEQERELLPADWIQPQTDEFPDSDSMASYDEEEQKTRAEHQLRLLMDYAGIFRDPPIFLDVDPSTGKPIENKKQKPAPKKGKGKSKKRQKKAQTPEPAPEPAEQDEQPGQSGPEKIKEFLPGWDWYHYQNASIPRALSSRIRHHLDHIERMKEAWRPKPGKKMGMPEDWFQEEVVIVLASNRPWESDKYDREEIFRTRMAFYTEPIGEHLERIPTKNLIRRHLSTRLSQSLLPDFCFHFRLTRPKGIAEGDHIEIFPCLERFLEVVNMPMGENNVESAFITFFTNIPLCWLLVTPKQQWWGPMTFEDSPSRIEFALVHNTIRPYKKEEVEIARTWPISYTRPAVLIAMKGPVQWPDFVRKWDQAPHFETEEWQRKTPEERLSHCVEDLACAVQPSLDTFVMTWWLRVQQQVIPRRSEQAAEVPLFPPAAEGENVKEFLPDPLDQEPTPKTLYWWDFPEWGWIPGILYDWEKCYLVAHIPILPDDPDGPEPINYVSYVFDEIPLYRPATGDDDDRHCLVERVRLGLAWMALQKHASKLTSMWDNVMHPMDIIKYEEFLGMGKHKYGFVERPPSAIRRPPRYVAIQEPYYERNEEDLESIRKYQEADLDEIYTFKSDDARAYRRAMKKSLPYIHRSVSRKVKKWLAEVENIPYDPDEDMDEVRTTPKDASEPTADQEKLTISGRKSEKPTEGEQVQEEPEAQQSMGVESSAPEDRGDGEESSGSEGDGLDHVATTFIRGSNLTNRPEPARGGEGQEYDG